MTWLMIFDFLGTIAFAFSGTITAVRHRMDIFGVNILAVVTATGGGMMRDIVIGDFPPKAFRDPFYALISMATANVVFLVQYGRQKRRKDLPLPKNIAQVSERLLFWMDTLGLGAFTVDGVMIGIHAGGGLFLITAIATKGGIGGGDIKLVALLGFCYGMEQTATLVTIACLIALIHVSDIAKKQGRMPKNIPFVPYLTAGCLIQTIILLYFWGE